MSIKNKLLTSVMVSGAMVSHPVLAADWTDKVTIKGFSSAVYQKTDDPVYFNGDCARTFTGMVQDRCPGANDDAINGTTNGVAPELGGINQDGSFRRTRVGLNINANVNEMVSLQTQFLAAEEENEFGMHLDWGFISLALNDNNSIRLGKIKMPVGLINEYQSVGYAYPWIEAPQLFYTQDFNGANITRESYRGISYLYTAYVGDWTLSGDLYGGNVALEGMSLNNMAGLTIKVDWDESVYAQLSTYSGTMAHNPRMPAMLDKKHRVNTAGIGGDLDGFLFYAEWAHVTMGMDIQESNTWYASAGYQFGDVTLLLTHQDMAKGNENVADSMKNEQTIDSINLRYDFAYNTAVKLELSQINTDKGVGLFAAGAMMDVKPEDKVNMFGVSLDVLF